MDAVPLPVRALVPTIDGVPVLLPPHDHPAFGTPGQHYHIDYRYCPDEPRQDRVIHSEAEPVYLIADLVRPGGYRIISASVNLTLGLTRQHLGRRLACGRCPHRGLPVSDGVCPGHGLAFDADGLVVDAYRLRINDGLAEPVPVPLAEGSVVVQFEVTGFGATKFVELLTPDDRVVARVPLTPGTPTIPGDLLKVRVK